MQTHRRSLLLAALCAPALARAAQRTIELQPFDAIDVGEAFVLKLVQAQAPRATVYGDDGRTDDVDAVVRNGTLGFVRRGAGRKLRIDVQVWKLERITLDGSARIEADALAAKSLQLRIDGSGVLKIGALTAETLKVDLDGSGLLRAAGRANDLDLHVDGAAVAELDRLLVRRVHVAIDGAGAASVNASARLSGSVGGAGSLRQRGSAVADLSRSGAGRVRSG